MEISVGVITEDLAEAGNVTSLLAPLTVSASLLSLQIGCGACVVSVANTSLTTVMESFFAPSPPPPSPPPSPPPPSPPPSPPPAPPPTDVTIALRHLYYATGGSTTWVDSTNWLVGEPCADRWHGVACCPKDAKLFVTEQDVDYCCPSQPCPADSSLRYELGSNETRAVCESGSSTEAAKCVVVRLALPSNNLTGRLDAAQPEGVDQPDLLSLESLVELDLTDNSITGVLPASLSSRVWNRLALRLNRFYYSADCASDADAVSSTNSTANCDASGPSPTTSKAVQHCKGVSYVCGHSDRTPPSPPPALPSRHRSLRRHGGALCRRYCEGLPRVLRQLHLASRHALDEHAPVAWEDASIRAGTCSLRYRPPL